MEISRKELNGSIYEYQSLRDGEIRLLQLSYTSEASIAHGTLVHVDVDESSTYEALSYTWGSAEKSSVLQLREGFLPITPNLASALLHLRRPDGPRLLWVDQICINQCDLVERARQVSLMPRIYALADVVRVWLGDLDHKTEAALDMLPFVVEGVRRYTSDSSSSPINPIISLGAPMVGASTWYWLSEILVRPYFKRLWVIQEVVLARRERVLVNCGTWEGSWEDIALASHQFEFDQQSMTVCNTAAKIDRMRLARLRDGQRYKLLDLLFETYFFQCQDPRDKVYAVLGLADSLILSADYSLSVEDVYLDTARRLIFESRDLALLRNIVCPSGRDLPSWVPDWTCNIRIRQRITPSAHLLKVEKDYPPEHQSFEIVGRSLFASCMVLGTIESVSVVMMDSWGDHLIHWKEMALSASHIGNLTFPETYWRALLATDESTNDCRLAKNGKEYYPAWQHYTDSAHHREKVTGTLESSDHLSPEEIRKHSVAFQNLMEPICVGRKFMTTTDAYLVLGPETANIGDQVCWLDDCPTPMVLRELNSNKKVIVGACYAQGFMDGPRFWKGESDKTRIHLL